MDKNVPRKFVGIINAIWIITIWMGLIFGLLMLTIYLYKQALGVYTIEDDIRDLQQRVHALEVQ
jgi:hypothetical protein